MTSAAKKVLYFIKSPAHNLKAIELFLSKRNFVVHSNTDLKEALTQVIELQPDFIFLAWDHSSPLVANLPKLIGHACASQIVPFIMSSTKEASRRFNLCPLNPKLYPPLSGPAIERLVLKSGLHSQEQAHRSHLLKARTGNKEDLQNIKSMLVANLEAINGEEIAEAEAKAAAETLLRQEDEKKSRQGSIEKRNQILKNSPQTGLTTRNIAELQKTFEDKIRQPLENLINTLNETQNYGQVTVTETPEGPVGTARLEEAPPGKSGVIIQQGLANPQGLGNTIQKGTGPGSHLGVVVPQNGSETRSYGGVTFAEASRAYCMAVFSDNWCGYLVITTSAQLDFSSIDMIFSDWMGTQFTNVQEIDEDDFFEFRDLDPAFLKTLRAKADYSESLRISGHDFSISFFPFDSSKMNIELSDDKSLIKVLTEDIPADQELGFSLHLHLPENKKFLLYTQANKPLSFEQKKRLLGNKIYLLYTSIDFEKEYKKFMTEKNVREIYENLNKKFSK